MENKISAKAFGLLVLISQQGVNISAEELMKHFEDGRRSVLSGLKELRTYGLIRTSNQRIGNRIIKMSTLTDAGIHYVESHFVKSRFSTSVSLDKQIKQNNAYSTFISKPSTSTESMENEREEFEEMPYEFFPSTEGVSEDASNPAKRRKAIEDEKKKKHDQKKEKTRTTRYEKRHKNPISKWSYADLGFEFADRIFVWNIAPWSVTQSRFIQTLADNCRRLDIDIEVAHAAMEIFFRQIDLAEYKDGEVLWKLFIHRLPGLVGQAKLSMNTEESDAVAKEAFALAMKRLRGE